MDPALVSILVTGVPLSGAGLIAWGAVRERATRLQKDVDSKASKEIVEANYREIIDRLDRIEDIVTQRK